MLNHIFGKNKKDIDLLSAELGQGVVTVTVTQV